MKVNKGTNNVIKREKYLGIEAPLFWMLLGSFLLRVVFFAVYTAMGGNGEVPDTPTYVDSAWSFVNSFSFGASALRTPGYPFILSLCMFVMGKAFYYGTVFVQVLLNVLAIYFLYKLAMLVVGNKKAAYIAVIIAALNPLDIRYCYLILTDSISQSLLVISIYFYARYIDSLDKCEKGFSHLAISSVLIALNVLIRPSLMFLPFALAIGAAFVAIIRRKYKQIVISVLCISIASALCITLWTARNEKVADYSGYSSVSDVNLYVYNSAAVYAKQNGMTYYEAFSILNNNKDDGLAPYLETMSKHEAYRKRGMEIIASDLPYYIACCAKNCAYISVYPGMMTFDFVTGSLDSVIADIKSGDGIVSGLIKSINIKTFFALSVLALDVALLLLLSVLAIVGIIKNFKKDWILTLLIVGVLAYIFVVSCQPVGIGSYSRFRLACSMFINMFAAYGIYGLGMLFQKRFKKKKGV